MVLVILVVPCKVKSSLAAVPPSTIGTVTPVVKVGEAANTTFPLPVVDNSSMTPLPAVALPRTFPEVIFCILA